MTVLVFVVASFLGCTPRYSIPQESQSVFARSQQTRTVIRSGSLELRSKTPADIKLEIDRIVDNVDGWVASWSLENHRVLYMTLRVPEPELDTTMAKVAALGKVVRRSLHSTDVSEELVDLEVRLENLKALRARLRVYLEQTQDLKEILEVEKELTRVQTEIESLEARLKVLRGKVAMSELEIAVKKRRWFWAS